MITAVLNENGNAIMGMDGSFVHFGGNFKVYRKPHSVRCRAEWAARWSTPTLKITAIEDGFEVTTRNETYPLGYTQFGLEMLMTLLSKDRLYRKCKFHSEQYRVISVRVRPR